MIRLAAILATKQLTYTYPDGTPALKGVDLEVYPGEKLAILGSNGSGKSTLFLCLNGVLKASGGQILWGEQPLRYDKKSLLTMRKNVGIVFQDSETQLFCLNVYQEVAFGPANLGYDPAQLEPWVLSNLENVDVLGLKDKPPHFLSCGQKKRVAIAAVLAMSPQVVIFDEPTSALDPQHAQQIMALMDELNRRGITVVMSTHDVEIAYAWADRVVVMHNGLIHKSGPPADIFADHELVQLADLQVPLVMRVYEKLLGQGLLEREKTSPPRNIEELEACLEQLSGSKGMKKP